MAASAGIYDFFVSHASEDLAAARTLHQKLSSRHQVFLDVECLAAGMHWPVEIERALRASKITVVLLSPRACEKRYVLEEICCALDEEKVVVPVLLPVWDTSQHKLPLGLKTRQYLRLNGEESYAHVAEKLASLVAEGGRGGGSGAANPKDNGSSVVEDVTAQPSDSTPRHQLLQYPTGPFVDPMLVPVSLKCEYAELFREPNERDEVVNAAVEYLRRADKDAKVLKRGSLAPNQSVATAYWATAFTQAALFGPRMLAALVEIVDADRFAGDVSKDRHKLLHDLRRHK